MAMEQLQATGPVLVIGATGYIGSAVAAAMARAGYEVLGWARSTEAERKLMARGYAAIRGDLRNPDSVAHAAQAVSAVIHAANTSGSDAPKADRDVIDGVIRALEGTGRRFVYTSAAWVHGNTGGHTVDESAPLSPPPLLQWRPAHEQRVLQAVTRGVHSIVIRPAIVYGHGGGIPAMLVRMGQRQGVVRFVGTGDQHWPTVHVDDLADLYVRALRHAPAGAVYLAAAGPAVRVRDIAQAASHAAGVPGMVAALPMAEARRIYGPFADVLALDQSVSAEKAMRELGWNPTAPSILEELMHGSYVQSGNRQPRSLRHLSTP